MQLLQTNDWFSFNIVAVEMRLNGVLRVSADAVTADLNDQQSQQNKLQTCHSLVLLITTSTFVS